MMSVGEKVLNFLEKHSPEKFDQKVFLCRYVLCVCLCAMFIVVLIAENLLYNIIYYII